jgi:hypothetical protein
MDCPKQTAKKIVMSERSAALQGVIRAALEISEQRREVLLKLRDALLRDDIEAIKLHARRLCGIEDEPESHKPKPRRSKPSKTKGRP